MPSPFERLVAIEFVGNRATLKRSIEEFSVMRHVAGHQGNLPRTSAAESWRWPVSRLTPNRRNRQLDPSAKFSDEVIQRENWSPSFPSSVGLLSAGAGSAIASSKYWLETRKKRSEIFAKARCTTVCPDYMVPPELYFQANTHTNLDRMDARAFKRPSRIEKNDSNACPDNRQESNRVTKRHGTLCLNRKLERCHRTHCLTTTIGNGPRTERKTSYVTFPSC